MRKRLSLLAAIMGSFVALLDSTVVNVALPAIADDLGGGLAGHNGLKSLKRELGGADFQRVRVGVGRPDSTDPDIVASYVLARFAEPREDVEALVERAADAVERMVERPPGE